jgi:hypothetical protein
MGRLLSPEVSTTTSELFVASAMRASACFVVAVCSCFRVERARVSI